MKASHFIAFYAVLLLAGGLVFLFASKEVGTAVDGATAGRVFPQLLGAAMLGFGVVNWTARRAVLGGIYGRAIVVGNQVFAFVGAMSMLGQMGASPDPGFWMLLAVLACGAVLYTLLLWRGPFSNDAPIDG